VLEKNTLLTFAMKSISGESILAPAFETVAARRFTGMQAVFNEYTLSMVVADAF